MKRRLAAIILLAIMIPTIRASALTAAELQIQIGDLLRRIEELKGRLEAAKLPQKEFKRDLYFGLKGSAEVKKLQEFLIARGHLAAGLDTGNFYSLTAKAVKNYQTANGISTTGYFGPLTRAKVNAELAAEAQAAAQAAALSAETKKENGAAGGYLVFVRPQYEEGEITLAIHERINKERTAAGLRLLIWDDAPAAMASRHSRDQAADNVELTDPDKLCSYPIIRHEGFVFGFDLRERLENSGISYRAAGENIAMLPLTKNLVYKYPEKNPPPLCPEIRRFVPGEGTREERMSLYREIMAESLAAARSAEAVEWVNQEWLSVGEIAEKAVAGWMNSPNHRRNILNPDFTYDGLGLAFINDYLIVTHNFLGK